MPPPSFDRSSDNDFRSFLRLFFPFLSSIMLTEGGVAHTPCILFLLQPLLPFSLLCFLPFSPIHPFPSLFLPFSFPSSSYPSFLHTHRRLFFRSALPLLFPHPSRPVSRFLLCCFSLASPHLLKKKRKQGGHFFIQPTKQPLPVSTQGQTSLR